MRTLATVGGWVVWALRLEWRMYVGGFRLLTRRSDVPPGSTPLAYVGAVSALLWGITAVSLVELVALHLILPWEGVRLAADILGIWGVVWCLGFTACHYVYPHLLVPDAVVLRTAEREAAVRVPLTSIAAVSQRERSLESSKALQVSDGVLSVVVASRTNVELHLDPPLEVTVRGVVHEVREVRLCADEAREAARLIRAQVGSGAPGSI